MQKDDMIQKYSAIQKYDMVQFEGQILMVDKVMGTGGNLELVDAQGALVVIAGVEEVYVLDQADKMRVRLEVVKQWVYSDA